jgi:hypothetical protein
MGSYARNALCRVSLLLPSLRGSMGPEQGKAHREAREEPALARTAAPVWASTSEKTVGHFCEQAKERDLPWGGG